MKYQGVQKSFVKNKILQGESYDKREGIEKGIFNCDKETNFMKFCELSNCIIVTDSSKSNRIFRF